MRRILAIVLVAAACGPNPPAPPNTTVPQATAAPTAAPTPTSAPSPSTTSAPVTLKEYPVPAGSGPHDVAPALDGGVWFTAQRGGQLGWLDPNSGRTKMIPLGTGSAPHGVTVGPDGAPWITDGGLNAIVRVDPRTSEVTRYPLPGRNIDLNTAVFEAYPSGRLWFTGQSGYIGYLSFDLGSGRTSGPFVSAAPRGAGPYGITAQPSGAAPGVYYASLAGNHIGRISIHVTTTGIAFDAEPLDPPTPGQGARRVWSDSKGAIWVSEWNAGQLGRYDPKTAQWKEWKLPNGARPQAYAVFVDDRDVVWLSEWSSSSIVRFDPTTETFTSFPYTPNGGVRQISGRPGEVWGALSALDRLIVLTTR